MDGIKYRAINFDFKYLSRTLKLLAELWGYNHDWNNAYFEWKYLSNPYTDHPRIYLALHNDLLVGVRSFSATCWQVGHSHKQFLCLAGADTVIHPDYRRKGLLKTLTIHALEDMRDSPYEYIISLSANRHAAAANLKLGWTNVGFVETAYRSSLPKPAQSCVWKQIPRRMLLLPNMYRYLRRKMMRENARPETGGSSFQDFDLNVARRKKCKLDPNLSFGNYPRSRAMADLVERISSDNHIQHVRDREFFTWRYHNPRSEYRFLYWGDEQLDGYLILRGRMNHNDGKVMIVDWEASEPEIARQLLQAAIQLGNFTALSIWSETLSVDRKQLLADFGFQFAEFDEKKSADFPPLVLIRPVRLDMVRSEWKIHEHSMLEMSNWDLRAIYSDGI